MTKISQKDSVVNEVKNALGIMFDPSVPARLQLKDSQISAIKTSIVNGICNGTIEYSKDTSDRREVIRYVSGMFSNHLRKAKELNGQVKYEPSSEKPRASLGSKDQQLIELNKLLSTYSEGTEEYNQVLKAIQERESQIFTSTKKTKKQTSDINAELLPEDLKHLIS